jgi:hypothetical protein
MDMMAVLLTGLIFVAALLYASVGHAGASGYLAVMALLGVAPAEMKPAALVLNILVAVIASWKFWRAGAFSWRLFWPVALVSIPLAYLGGQITLPGHLYKPLVGAVLLYAAWRFFRSPDFSARATAPPPYALAMLAGAAMGFLSGLTGVGGGIFLSPLFLFCGWGKIREVSGVAALFILVNSAAGLLGAMTNGITLPAALPYWAAAAVLGGFIGAELGSRRLPGEKMQKVLALVLVIAGVKMISSAWM